MPRPKKERLKARKDGRYKCKYHGLQFYGATQEEAFAKRDAYKLTENASFSILSPVSAYALPWLERSYPEVSESTYTGLAIHLQHLIDTIGNKRISEVTPSDIKAIYSGQYKGYSNSYIMTARQLYCSLFDSAVADGLIRYNPARDKTAKPHKGKKPSTRAITPQERQWIETLCTDHRAHPAVMAMLYAGLRPQEMKAVIIERDVDFDKGIITIHETAHKNGAKYAYTAQGKTDNANRQIPLFQPLRAVLEGKKGYLIASAHGQRVSADTWVNAWESYKNKMEAAINGTTKGWYGKTIEHKKLLAEGKSLPAWKPFDIVPYDLRHSFCTMCRDAGVELNTCRKWMGHADASMILRVYDSVTEDRSEQERKKVESRLFGVQNGVQDQQERHRTIEK